MAKSRFLLLLASITAITLVLAGCAQPATTTPTSPATTTATSTVKPTTTPPTSAPKGPYGDLRVAIASFGEERMDPTKVSYTVTGNLHAPMYDFLISLDREGKLAPGIAEKWEMAPDGLSWTYYIRKGVKFHNGEELTAADVKYSFDRYNSPDSFYPDLKNMTERVEVVDDYTVKVITKGTQPWYEYFTATYSKGQGMVQPKDYIESNGADYFERHPVGTGPFKYANRVPGDMVEYQAVDSHWRIVPAFKRLMMILMPEETTRIASLKTGAVDVVDVSLEGAADIEAAGLRSAAMDVFTPMVILHGAYTAQGAGKPTADVRVRQALSLAINRDEIRKSFFYGKAGPATPPFLWEGSPGIDGKSWMDYAAKAYRYDLDEAKKLLKEAGYADGFSIKIWGAAIRGAPYLPKLAEVIAGYWGNIGVKTEIVPIDWGTLTSMRSKPAPELIGNASMFRYDTGPNTAKNLIAGFSGKTRMYALLDTANPRMEDLLNGILTGTDLEKRKEMLKEAVQIAFDSYTSLMLAQAPMMAGLGPKVDIDFPPKAALAIGLFAEIAKHR